MVICAQCTSSKNNNNKTKKQKKNKKKKKQINFLKRALTTLGAAILFCLVAMQRSVSESESAPNTVTKRHKALFGNVTLHSEAKRSVTLALCNSSQLYGQSPASADSRSAAVSYWRMYVPNTGYPLRGLLVNRLGTEPFQVNV